MRNREATLRKLDSIESNLNRVVLTLNQGDREGCYEVINLLREQVEQIKMYIESEPIAGNELNPLY
jgi:hypothetical protein